MKHLISSFVFLSLITSFAKADESPKMCAELMQVVQSKQHLIDLALQKKPYLYLFVKDLPILGYRIESGEFSDLPGTITKNLGDVDATEYSEKYLKKNIGSVVGLQMNGDKPDFYVLGIETLLSKYKPVSMELFATNNPKLNDSLKKTDVGSLLESNDPKVVALLKTEPVEMIRASALGFPVDEELNIESPWGTQTKPEGQDAFLVYDLSKGQFYMVNTDERALPIGYILHKNEGVQSKKFLIRTAENSGAKIHNYIKDLPIMGYRITSGKLSDLPKSIADALGSEDNTSYDEKYLEANIGSVIALQVNKGKTDFYVIGLDTFKGAYVEVEQTELALKNPKLFEGLQQTDVSSLINSNNPNLVSLLKTKPVQMYKMSELGFPIYEEIVNESPWGDQTKHAGQEGYITFDHDNGQYYTINSNEDGLPIGYIEADDI